MLISMQIQGKHNTITAYSIKKNMFSTRKNIVFEIDKNKTNFKKFQIRIKS